MPYEAVHSTMKHTPKIFYLIYSLFIIHYSLFTNSVGRHVLQTKKKRGAQPIWLCAS